MENRKFYPIGTIVQLRNSNEIVMIVQRAVMINLYYKDYMAVSYPAGYEEESKLSYFNDEEIDDVVSQGYTGTGERGTVANINAKLNKGNYGINDKELPIIKDTTLGMPIFQLESKLNNDEFKTEYSKRKFWAYAVSITFLVISVIRFFMN